MMASDETSWNGRKVYCCRCGHLWMVRGDKQPKLCPRCRSSRYDVPLKKEHTCLFCGNIWEMKGIDDRCPGCGKGIYDTSDPLQHHCNQCDYVWSARTEGRPARCPLCNSSKWDSPKIPQYTCKRCGHVWSNDKGIPGRCPKCQSLKWNENAFKLQCRRCGYKWIANNTHRQQSVAQSLALVQLQRDHLHVARLFALHHPPTLQAVAQFLIICRPLRGGGW